jgi:hypothetical protein
MNFAALPDTPGANCPHAPVHADRHNRQLTKTQPRRPQAVAEHLANGVRDQRTGSLRGGMARPRSSFVHQGKSTSARTMNRPVAVVDHPAAVPAADADHRQAEYFLRLLAQSRRQLGQRIDGYHRAIAIAQVSGATDDASGIRHVMRIAEQEQQALGGLIDRLQRRFRVRP